MKIQINEVWNADGKSKELAVIDVEGGRNPRVAVLDWIDANRPELTMALTLSDHGYHARQIG